MLAFIIIFSCFIPLGIWLRFFTPSPHSWFGYNTDRPLHNEEDWIMAHKALGICFIYSGSVLTGSSVIAMFFPEFRVEYIFLMLVGFAAATFFIVRYLHHSDIHSK